MNSPEGGNRSLPLFIDYLDETMSHSKSVYKNMPEAAHLAQVLFDLSTKNLWSAAFFVTFRVHSKEHPVFVYIDSTNENALRLMEIYSRIIQDGDRFDVVLQRYRQYRSCVTQLVNQEFTEVLQQLPPCSVGNMMKQMKHRFIDVQRELMEGTTVFPLVEHYMDDEIKNTEPMRKVVHHSLASEIRIIYDTLNNGIFSKLMLERSQGRLPLPEGVSVTDGLRFIPSRFTSSEPLLKNNHTTCPGMNYAGKFLEMVYTKALPYWQAGGQEKI